MPKVKLGRDPAEERAKTIRSVINAKRGERDIQSQKDLAEMAGINRTTLSAKMRNGTWTLADLTRLDRVLRFDVDDLRQIVRGSR
ncbi:helix-turn-helix transcriptional regulator [Oscillibacter sp. MSJ-2]|uniref:Helix-turn-helix transcriptional regulator n=1 Tax=Dysosmobacter acutus TaxID=2841504 RepID=A0ABS6FBT3_9FIRM|nr:helix-turn-helix transcriptional regulator [Dysosmobacter acutus]MBU5627739.1 helix-turn-helix transcriptional regulator [Dysosmobacter acutus]